MSSMDLRTRLRAFSAEHHLTDAALARHARISYSTLRVFLAGEHEPRQTTVTTLEVALRRPPAPRIPKHGQAVAAAWGTKTSDEIGRPLGISGARVRAIAKRMGLSTGESPPAQS